VLLKTTEFKIRDALSQDANSLAAAEREIAKTPGRLASRPHELKDEAFRERIIALTNSQNGKYVVIELNGKIVGHALLDPLKLEVTAHVVDLTIAIHEGHHRKGFGEAMLRHLIEWAKANPKVEKIMLHVRSSNKGAISLYEKTGFVIEGVRVKMIKIGDQPEVLIPPTMFRISSQAVS
jgi:ribosomal protein S18 acetylase RimI-like enzyme